MNKLLRRKVSMFLCTPKSSKKLFCGNDLQSKFRHCPCRLLQNLTPWPHDSGKTSLPRAHTLTTSRTLSSTKRNFYDVLGITPKATPKEVKAAYFKLSKVYHPDATEATDESTARFRDISEAYEVLGNAESRKEYDSRWLSKQFDPDSPIPEFRARRPPPTGRSSIYNYDEWTRTHYSEIFERQARELRRRQWKADNREVKGPSVVRALMVLTNVLCILIVIQFISSHYVDQPTPSDDKKPK